MKLPVLLCSVYKSPRKSGMFLYVPNKDDFEAVPAPLMQRFGAPLLVMHVPRNTEKKLHSVSPEKLASAFEQDGFYLQMPPKQENWLEEHRAELGLNAVERKPE